MFAPLVLYYLNVRPLINHFFYLYTVYMRVFMYTDKYILLFKTNEGQSNMASIISFYCPLPSCVL